MKTRCLSQWRPSGTIYFIEVKTGSKWVPWPDAAHTITYTDVAKAEFVAHELSLRSEVNEIVSEYG